MVCLFLCLSCCVCSCVFELSHARPLGLQQSFTQYPILPHVLQVCVACVVCASSFRVWVFAFVLLLAFLERVDLHPVVVIRTCSVSN